MALQARRFDEALRQHVEIPHVLVFPGVFVLPALLGGEVLGVCAARAKAVADGWPLWQLVAAELLGGVLAVGTTNRSSRGWAAELADAGRRQLFVRQNRQLELLGIRDVAAFVHAREQFLAFQENLLCFFENILHLGDASYHKSSRFSRVNAGLSMPWWQVMQRSKRVTPLKL